MGLKTKPGVEATQAFIALNPKITPTHTQKKKRSEFAFISKKWIGYLLKEWL